MSGFEELTTFLGLDRYRELEDAYLPDQQLESKYRRQGEERSIMAWRQTQPGFASPD